MTTDRQTLEMAASSGVDGPTMVIKEYDPELFPASAAHRPLQRAHFGLAEQWPRVDDLAAPVCQGHVLAVAFQSLSLLSS